MSWWAADPPPAPDFAGAAAAQGAANRESAIAQGHINNPNVINPYGTQTVTWGNGTPAPTPPTGADPAAWAAYAVQLQNWSAGQANGTQPTITQTLSPEQQRIYDQQTANQIGLGGVAAQGISSLGGLIGKPIDLSSAPGLPTAFSPSSRGMPVPLNSRGLPGMPQPFQAPTNLPGMPGSSDQVRQRVIDAMMGRANKDFAQREDQTNSDLIARGLRPGTEAYAREMERIDQARNDARSQAEIAGGDAAAQAHAMDLANRQQGQGEAIANSALSYTQGMGIRGQAVGEQAQQFEQGGKVAQLTQQQQQQQYQQQQELRRQVINELLAQRQTPLNEITALMSGSQVSNPFSMPGYAQNGSVAPPPLFGAATAQSQWDADRYNAGVGSSNSLLSGLFGLGSAWAGSPSGAAKIGGWFSDRRLKSNVVHVAAHPLGIGIYEYDIFGQRELGVMADEVLEVKPEAVEFHPSGYMIVRYDLIGVQQC